MAFDINHSSSGNDHGAGRRRRSMPWELLILGGTLVLAPAVAATAMALGSSPAAAAVVMVTVIGAGVWCTRLISPQRGFESTEAAAPERTAKGRRRRLGLDLGAGRTPTPVEARLSAKYGVPIEQVAGHVWLISGELIEATLDPATFRLMSGRSELTVRPRDRR